MRATAPTVEWRFGAVWRFGAASALAIPADAYIDAWLEAFARFEAEHPGVAVAARCRPWSRARRAQHERHIVAPRCLRARILVGRMPTAADLLSALISPGGLSAALLLELRAGAFELVVSPALLAELGEVLPRPKFGAYVTPAEIAAYVELIGHESTIREDPPLSGQALSCDPDDEYLIALARVARVDALVSGDAHLLDLRRLVYS